MRKGRYRKEALVIGGYSRENELSCLRRPTESVRTGGKALTLRRSTTAAIGESPMELGDPKISLGISKKSVLGQRPSSSIRTSTVAPSSTDQRLSEVKSQAIRLFPGRNFGGLSKSSRAPTQPPTSPSESTLPTSLRASTSEEASNTEQTATYGTS